jgi:hypothetical protein
MQNNVCESACETSVDFEFEMSGEEFSELEWEQLRMLKTKNHEVAIAVEKTLMKNLWETVSLKELKTTLIKNLSFLNLVKVKLDFGEDRSTSLHQQEGVFIHRGDVGIYGAINAIKTIPATFSDNLFGWVYYKDKNDDLETFRFIINIETGKTKYFD